MTATSEIIGILAGVITSISLLPQLIKVVKEKQAKNISYFMPILLITGLGCWVWYGIFKNDYPIIVTNIFSIVVNILLIIFAAKYKTKND